MCQEVRRSYYEDQKNRKLRKMIIMILVLRSCGFLKIVNLMVVISGGDKAIERRKLSWTSKSKIGSLEKANHRPGGGQVRIFFCIYFFRCISLCRCIYFCNCNSFLGKLPMLDP